METVSIKDLANNYLSKVESLSPDNFDKFQDEYTNELVFICERLIELENGLDGIKNIINNTKGEIDEKINDKKSYQV